MLEVLAMGGFTTGGLNFDAKVRRQSHDPIDLFYAHIGGMDCEVQRFRPVFGLPKLGLVIKAS